MSPRIDVVIEVNGEPVEARVGLNETLLSFLRERCQLTGVKRGCNQGVCGACTVTVGGEPRRACLTLAADCHAPVETVEAGERDPVMAALQDAFAAGGAMQCGFCTAGMLATSRALLAAEPSPDAERVRAALSGNLCRCTGYVKIVDAVLAAAEGLKTRLKAEPKA